MAQAKQHRKGAHNARLGWGAQKWWVLKALLGPKKSPSGAWPKGLILFTLQWWVVQGLNL
jgi:hypothetical protein